MRLLISEVYKGMTYQGIDYSDRLEVSNYGNIRNSVSKRVYKLNLVGSGYLGACISLGSRTNKKCFKAHKAVAETFIPNPHELPIVNHKDGVKTNCFVGNLEWCTPKHNIRHSFELGLSLNPKGFDSPQSKISEEDSKYIKAHYKPRDKTFGARALGRKFNVDHVSILNHVNK